MPETVCLAALASGLLAGAAAGKRARFVSHDDGPDLLFEGGLAEGPDGKTRDAKAAAKALGMTTATVRTLEPATGADLARSNERLVKALTCLSKDHECRLPADTLTSEASPRNLPPAKE